MSYELDFHPDAWSEWNKLDGSIKAMFKKKLKERLETPRVQKDALRGIHNGYKIKLRDAGYRLVYQVREEAVVLLVIAIGKRDKDAVYRSAENRAT